jgi:hypothetical protein
VAAIKQIYNPDSSAITISILLSLEERNISRSWTLPTPVKTLKIG